jgi:putative flippase GtrA
MSADRDPGANPSAPSGGGSRTAALVAQFWELLRFGWVGTLTLGIYVVELWLLDRFCDLPTWLDATFAYGPCLVINYLLQRTFTFRSGKRHSLAGPRYLVIQLGGLAINSGFIWLGAEVLHWPFLVAQFAALATLALWSYLGQKLWAFL